MYHLLRNGDKQDDDNSNSIRQRAISLLCQMNPIEMANVRSKCIEWCRMPSLALRLTIDMQEHNQSDPDDLVSFMSGLLLGTDPQVRHTYGTQILYGSEREKLICIVSCLYRLGLGSHFLCAVDRREETSICLLIESAYC